MSVVTARSFQRLLAIAALVTLLVAAPARAGFNDWDASPNLDGAEDSLSYAYQVRDRARANVDRPGHALGDQPFAVVGERWNEQQERENQEPDQEGQQQFTDNIAIDDPQHTDSPDHTT